MPVLSEKRHKRLLIVIGFVLSAVFLFFTLRGTDWAVIRDSLLSAVFLPWLPLAVASYLVGHLVRGLRLKLIISSESRISVLTATNIVVVGYAVNNLLPARMGELSRAGMLRERTGIPYLQCLSVTVIERLFDGVAITLLLAVSALYLNAADFARQTLVTAAVLFGAATLVFMVVLLKPGLITGTASLILRNISPRLHGKLFSALISALNSVKYLRSYGNALRVGLLSLAVWLFEAGLFLFLLPSFDLKMDPWHAVFIMSVINLGILIPSSPGFIGHFHFFCRQALVFLGVSATLAASYAIVTHLAFYLPITLWGVLVIVSYGMELRQQFRLVREAGRPDLGQVLARELSRPGRAAAGKPGPPGEFMLRLTEAVLPLELLDDRRGGEAAAQAAAFVRDQIAALPRLLRVLFSTGMLVFRTICWLMHGRSFVSLTRQQRARVVRSWSYGHFAPARQLFRPVRSTAMLAFFEHDHFIEKLENSKKNG